MDCLLLVSSESDSAALATLQQDFYVSRGPAVYGPSTFATLRSVRESLRERWPRVWRVGVPIGLNPTTNRYWYKAATVRRTKRFAQRAVTRLVNEADHGPMPLTNETLGHLLTRWVDQLKGADLDAFYDRLSQRGPSATSVRRYHAVCSAALRPGGQVGLLELSPAAQALPPNMVRNEPNAPTPQELKLLSLDSDPDQCQDHTNGSSDQ